MQPKNEGKNQLYVQEGEETITLTFSKDLTYNKNLTYPAMHLTVNNMATQNFYYLLKQLVIEKKNPEAQKILTKMLHLKASKIR
jgi:hypothetical protein